jgi:hypothetical protein
MTVVVAATGETFDAQLEEDEFHMLWLIHPNQRNSGRVQILLSAALQNGWRIVHASPDAGAARRTVRKSEGAVKLRISQQIASNGPAVHSLLLGEGNP